MQRFLLLPTVSTLFLGVLVLAGAARAATADGSGAVGEIALPGGLRAARAAIGDEVSPDRSLFLLEFIRRTYDTPLRINEPRSATLQALLQVLRNGARSGTVDTVPLPLPASLWSEAVFHGRATPATLIADILESRNASLLYAGLLALDDPTRAWVAAQPGLMTELASERAAAFLLAAPALRISGSTVSLPGGAAAQPVWAALAGASLSDAGRFVHTLISADEGRLAAFAGAMSELTGPQLTLVLNLDAAAAAARIDAARQVYAIFGRLLARKSQEHRIFTRPGLDPALLAASFSSGADGRIQVPGSRRLWITVFNAGPGALASGSAEQKLEAGGDEPVSFAWLCDAVFNGDPGEYRRRYLMVVFASRRLASGGLPTRRDTADAIQASVLYPALIQTLERAGVTDLSVMAGAARRAAELTAIGDEDRASRSIAQFQGLLAIVSRAGARGTLDARTVTSLVASLVAVAPNKSGDYEGRLVCWLADWLQPGTTVAGAQPSAIDAILDEAGGPVEAAVLRLLAGVSVDSLPIVEWEGTRYRVDFARADAIRMVRALGEAPAASLTAAETVVSIADALDGPAITGAALAQHAEDLRRALTGTAEPTAPVRPESWRSELASLTKAARSGNVKAAAKTAPALRLIADELLARGLTEMAYAAALGERDGFSISAPDAARRHDFGLRSKLRRSTPWWLPLPGTDVEQRWQVAGALLGLDVGLADFMLVRLSNKPPPRRPTIDEDDRRVFVQAVALVSPASLTASGRDAIIDAMARGRATLSAARSPQDVSAIGDAVGLSAPRRTALAWAVSHDPARVAPALSLSELFLLGAAPGQRLDAWGAPGTTRLGCLCLRGPERQPWELYAGRSHTGMTASVMPDLNFRLTELLADLHMPPSLLAPVLSSATLEFVNLAISRDPDDHRGPIEYVQALRRDRVEAYLALLTTDGPLVPIDEPPAPSPAQGARR